MTDQAIKSRLTQIIPLTLVLCAMFTIPLLITGSGVINSSIIAEFSASYSQGQWVIVSFMVAYSSFMALSGIIADAYGRKPCFLLGSLAFGLSSILATYASTIGVLIALRILMGIGAALVTTAGTAILADQYLGRTRQRVFAAFGTALGLGLALGPLVAGGVVAATGSWHLFYIGPAVILCLVGLGALYLAPTRVRTDREIDWGGGVTFALLLTLLVSAVTGIPSVGIKNSKIVVILIAIPFLTYVLYKFELKASSPIVDFELFRNKQFCLLCITAVALGLGYISLLFYLPQVLSAKYNNNSYTVGYLLSATTLPSLVLPPIITIFRKYLTNRMLLVATYVILSAAPLALSYVLRTDGTPDLVLAVVLFFVGGSFGTSLAFLDGAVVDCVPVNQAGAAAGMFNTFRLGGEAVMIPVVGVLLSQFITHEVGIRTVSALHLIQGNVASAASELGIELNQATEVLIRSFTLSLYVLSVVMFTCFAGVMFAERKRRSSGAAS